MGRKLHTLKFIHVLLFGFTFCCDSRHRNYCDECGPLLVGDKWAVQKFETEPSPMTYPYTGDQLVLAMQDGYYSWSLLDSHTIILNGQTDEALTFNYVVNDDTLILSSDVREDVWKFLIKEESRDSLTLALLGLNHLELHLKRQVRE
jgi:hypothetical protein